MSYYEYRSKDRDWEAIGLGCLGLIAIFVIVVLIGALISSWAWGLIVPTIFPTAVAQGALPASITLLQALKLSILFSILGLTGASSTKKKERRYYSSFWERLGLGLLAFIIAIPIWALLTVFIGWLISIVWGWVVPDVFAGAVALQLLPAKLSLWHSMLLSILFGVLGLSRHVATSGD